MSDSIQLKHPLWPVLLILMLTVVWGGEAVQAQNDSIVRVVYFYADDCEHCINTINEVLTPLQDVHGDRLQIKMIETNSDPANYEMLIRAEEMFDVSLEERGFPTLIVADQVLIGEEEIREQLSCLLDTCLGEGGTLWPDIPELEGIPIEGQENLGLGFEVAAIGEQPCPPEETGICTKETIFAAYFYQVGCKNCSRAEADIRYVRNRHTQLVTEDFNTYDNEELGRWLANRAGRADDWHAPALFVGNDALIGEEEITPQNLKALIQKYEFTGTEKIWEDFEPPPRNLPGVITVIVAGLLDGLNPCAFATLIFFISYLTVSERRGWEILAVGAAFTFGVFLTYLAIGLGLYKVLDQIRNEYSVISRWTLILTALFCGVLALLSFLDYVKARKGQIKDMALVMPEMIRRRIHTVIRRTSNAQAFVPVAFVTGAVISLLELACTGQPYLAMLISMTTVPEMSTQATLLRIPMKSTTSSGHVDHQSERSDASENIIHSSGRHGQMGIEFPSRLSLEIEPIGIVDQAIQDGVPDGWIREADVPLGNRHLSGNHSG